MRPARTAGRPVARLDLDAASRPAAPSVRRAAVLAIVALAAFAAPVAAHEWYTSQKSPDGLGCCGGRDCAPVDYNGVRCDATGCDVTILPGTHPMVPDGAGPVTFRYDGNPGLSPDGDAHACIVAEDMGRRRVRCLFVGGVM